MNLGLLRDQLAADRLGLRPAALQRMATELLGEPALFSLSGLSVAGDGQYSGATATPASVTLLILGALLGQPITGAWHSAVERSWHGQAYDLARPPASDAPLTRCPLTGRRLLGRALTAILARPQLAAMVVRIEVCRVSPIWTIWGRRQGAPPVRSVFVACHARELAEGLEALPNAASMSLPGTCLRELATVLAAG